MGMKSLGVRLWSLRMAALYCRMSSRDPSAVWQQRLLLDTTRPMWMIRLTGTAHRAPEAIRNCRSPTLGTVISSRLRLNGAPELLVSAGSPRVYALSGMHTGHPHSFARAHMPAPSALRGARSLGLQQSKHADAQSNPPAQRGCA